MNLSIIIPHYHLPAALLQRCLQSIMEQWTLAAPSWEVIVVDDGSPVSPAQTIQALHCPHIRLLTQQHRRQGAARNRGLLQAQGDYILFIDADDYLIPGTLQPLVQEALAQRPDILRFQLKPTSKSHVAPSPQRGISFKGTGEEYMSRHNLVDMPVCYLFRRQLTVDAGIRFPENAYLEDCVFTYRLHHAAQSVWVSDTIAYAYFQRKGSTTHNLSALHIAQLNTYHWNNLEDICQLIAEEKALGKEVRGLERKRAFLTVDYLIRLCRSLSWQQLSATELPRLHAGHLFPLPHARSYGVKYAAFRSLTTSGTGLRLLHFLISRRWILKD